MGAQIDALPGERRRFLFEHSASSATFGHFRKQRAGLTVYAV
jgi:hypothetical protein